MAGVYLYAVVPATASGTVDVSGLLDRPVRIVVHGELGALVSDADDEPLLGRRRELTRHAEVIEQALGHGPVLPLQFGTLAEDDADVVDRILGPRHDELRELLGQMDGLVEVRLRGYYDEESVLAEIVAEEPALQRVGASLDERINTGEQIARALEAKRDQEADAIVHALAPLARDTAHEPPTTEMMAVNAAFLVDADALDRFDAAVRELGEAVGDRIRLKYVGPVPPATFVDLSLSG